MLALPACSPFRLPTLPCASLLSSSFLGGRISDRWSKRATATLAAEADAAKAGDVASAAGASPADAINADFPRATGDSDGLVPAAPAPAPHVVDLSPFAFMPGLGCLLAAPLMALVFIVPNFYAAMALLFCAYVVGECWYAPLFALVQNGNMHAAEVKGMAIAVLVFGTSILSSPGPVVIGAVERHYHNLRLENVFGYAVPTVVAGFIFLLVGRRQRAHARAQAGAV